ncbi:hypothetical protein [Flammeovirga sp. SJP92]|uniref:hypothetical protein n=1 Tax=Flammeovirga sp. SJP92 TaxID=1775430 RepID=UPI000787E8F4|nr:hypothetical protein [Flammeovirga sp. SJP92]KXX71126.1 hypothetical protein AVL50_09855 [Flammeovirga sp. SJP92]
MKTYYRRIVGLILGLAFFSCSNEKDIHGETEVNENFSITSASAFYNEDLEQIVMSMEVQGVAGETIPIAIGQLDEAPVFAYVFPTSLKSEDIGFGIEEGIVAMALTSHPDFDDTPLWDENNDKNYTNDGVVWHPHWVLLVSDPRVKGGLSVKQFEVDAPNVTLPPTNTGMPMYMDSPGYQVVTEGKSISVVIPVAFINHKTNFNFDAVTARMQVNTSDSELPMLGVYEVYGILSKDLSLPFQSQ